jgi:rubrerythrin
LTLDLMKEKGIALDRQRFTWRDLVRAPISKLDDDAFTRVRVILMNGIESEAVRFSHAAARFHETAMRRILADVRRVEHHQQTMVNWLLGADHSPLETTLGYEQTAIEITASVALAEPDPYLAQMYRFGMLEDFDHLYRFSALMDRVEGRDANNILQSYTDIRPGRPTSVEHRAPVDDVRDHYDRKVAAPLTKMNALTIVSAENQVHDYYLNIGPIFADPVARQLYAEIASIEEQHVTHYESLTDPHETWLEKWVLHEATEVYNYWSCLKYETNPRLKEIWQRFVDYELGHLQVAITQFQNIERRDAAEILPRTLPDPIKYESHREFVRQVLESETHKRSVGPQVVDAEPAGSPSVLYRTHINSEGSPSEEVAAGYRWRPGTELALKTNGNGKHKEARA